VQRIGEGAPLPDRAVCLTFDDGFRNVMTQAEPILRQYQLPSTVFLVTSLPDSGLPPWPGMVLYALSKTKLGEAEFDGEKWPFDKGRKGLPVYDRLVRRLKALPGGARESRFEELIGLLSAGSPMDFMSSPRATMTWAEVEKLAAPGLMRFESHTHTHVSLSHCPIDEQKKELEISRNMLRARMPIENLFCYPFGDYSRATNEIVAQTGYRCALTTDSGLNSGTPDVYSLRRVLVGGDMSAATFEMAMLGCCE
jgi:peptidoglycan/xylan/chitin deacetylase (PgdA/CDA1 family)